MPPHSQAAGVQVIFGNAPPFTFPAIKEVIASAGAIKPPQLLMYNITIVFGSPGVGQDFWHALVLLSRNTSIAEDFDRLSGPGYAEQARMIYNANQTGPLSNGGTDYLAWEKLPEPYRSALGEGAQGLDGMFLFDWPEPKTEIASAERVPGSTVNTGMIIQSLVTPSSRGNISIRSNSMLDPSVMDLNLLSRHADQKLAVQYFRRMRQLFNTTAMRSILVGKNKCQDPVFRPMSRFWSISEMGARNDSMAPLDSRARVKGVEGLKVVDVSSFPRLPPRHPMSTVCKCFFLDLHLCLNADGFEINALAEKIAADILGNMS
ncbi:hypothetical protein BDZ45DRAFT_746755 [Acephala macrosclerotiorum]|nr:hypothetical protein BDZ45DRAFT_746755 [Acephala macrosclerotiorum]